MNRGLALVALFKGRDPPPQLRHLLPHALKVNGRDPSTPGHLVVNGLLGADKRTLALPDDNQALITELVHGALGRVHRDSELVGQLLIGRQLRTRGQLPGLDGRTQAAGDLEIRRTRVVWVQCHTPRLVNQLCQSNFTKSIDRVA